MTEQMVTSMVAQLMEQKVLSFFKDWAQEHLLETDIA